MAVIVVDVLSPEESVGTSSVVAQVTTVIRGANTPVTTNNVGTSVVQMVQPGGTVANVQWGYTLPEDPSDGKIFLLVTEV